jgi:tetratricopeptide (TPR) repeat protein
MSDIVDYSSCMADFNAEKYSDAIECFKKINQKDPSYIKALYNKGLCHMKLKQLKEAIKSFDKVIALDSKGYSIRF